MNRKDEARHGSCKTTKTHCNNNNVVWSGDISFSEDFSIFDDLLGEVETQKQKSMAVITGYAVDKSNKEDLVIADIRFIAGRIQTWAIRPAVNRPNVYAAATITDSTLDSLKDTDMVTKGLDIYQMLVDNVGIVPDFVALSRKDQFELNVFNFNEVVQMPQVKIDERATANGLMVSKLGEAMLFRKSNLLVSAKAFMESNVSFF